MSKKEILIVAELFPPSIGSSSKIMQDLAVYLSNQNFKVSVITTSSDKQAEKEYQNKFPAIKIFRHRAFFNKKSNYLLRGIFNIVSVIHMTLTALFRTKPDIVFLYTPPLFYGIIGIFLRLIKKSKLILNVQDLFPQNAVDLGILKEGLILSFFLKLEKFIYSNSDLITAHSDGNAKIIKNKLGHKKKKIITAHNWVRLNENIKVNRADSFPKKIIFGGVLGPSQVGGIIDFLNALKDFSNSEFILDIYGEGSEKEKLSKYISDNNINNTRLNSFLKAEEYDEALRHYDVGLVCLSKEVKTPVVPGKILGYMGAKLSCIAVANDNNDIHDMIMKSKCGFSSNFDTVNIKENLKKIQNSDVSMLGENGFNYAKDNLVVNKVAEKILNALYDG